MNYYNEIMFKLHNAYIKFGDYDPKNYKLELPVDVYNELLITNEIKDGTDKSGFFDAFAGVKVFVTKDVKIKLFRVVE